VERINGQDNTIKIVLASSLFFGCLTIRGLLSLDIPAICLAMPCYLPGYLSCYLHRKPQHSPAV